MLTNSEWCSYNHNIEVVTFTIAYRHKLKIAYPCQTHFVSKEIFFHRFSVYTFGKRRYFLFQPQGVRQIHYYSIPVKCYAIFSSSSENILQIKKNCDIFLLLLKTQIFGRSSEYSLLTVYISSENEKNKLYPFPHPRPTSAHTRKPIFN